MHCTNFLANSNISLDIPNSKNKQLRGRISILHKNASRYTYFWVTNRSWQRRSRGWHIACLCEHVTKPTESCARPTCVTWSGTAQRAEGSVCNRTVRQRDWNGIKGGNFNNADSSASIVQQWTFIIRMVWPTFFKGQKEGTISSQGKFVDCCFYCLFCNTTIVFIKYNYTWL